MNTFDTIVYKTINFKNNIFSYNYDTSDTVLGIYKIFFYNFINNTTDRKMRLFYDTINNFYFSKRDEERKVFISYFTKIQKIYRALNRFCFLYKTKKANMVVSTDLQLNEINIKQKNVILIYHNNSNYLFKIDDLLRIIYTSLTNTYMFFCEPITIKNPYNNLPFNKSILYYIYFYLVNNTHIGYINHNYIDVFFKFKQCDFNMTKFIDNYEYVLREYSIQNYIINTTKNQLKNDIIKMIKEFNLYSPNHKIHIDSEFPSELLVKIMKPYLHLYLTAFYSLVSKIKTDANIRLIKKLIDFQKYNPSFGKKIIVMKDKLKNGKIVKYKSHVEFNCKHKKFENYNSQQFMENHLSYKYNNEFDLEDNEESDSSDIPDEDSIS